MGITNFCKLIDPLHDPPNKPAPFDSILFDVQPFIHAGIASALESEESKLLLEVCRVAWYKLHKQLLQFLPFATNDSLTLVLSFDGEGVPMKWPTQRERRAKKDDTMDLKTKYRMVLFGVNQIALQVQAYFLSKLRHFTFRKLRQLHVYVSGCNVPGEGEHKLFHLAEALKTCRNPIVVSDDQDVFVISLMRLERYDSIQIYRYGRYYQVTRLYREWLPYPSKHLQVCSFLFGNDFVPALIGISLVNGPDIHQSMMIDAADHPVYMMAQFIQNMIQKIRFQRVTHMDNLLVESFWITFLWLYDYYTQTMFPQKYLENPVHQAFDRNQLLTALSDPDISLPCYERAKKAYDCATTALTTTKQAEYAVFGHDDILDQLKSYWVPQSSEACDVLHLTKKSSPRNR
ncbi:hypothetical protein JTE90_022610 [Oedothorax gibbosus]|uniref:Xrn1 N-terminal domain-containing protein n=2 Tax=Oedothorax gibbosus TaxID=931172 RepID=A0AAV6TUR6_9ARAC|nr:hypothetical protein JTE90_022610 [Oedothorax gibbosus]